MRQAVNLMSAFVLTGLKSFEHSANKHILIKIIKLACVNLEQHVRSHYVISHHE